MSRVWHAAATASRRRWSREGARLPVQTRGMRVVVVVVCRASLDCTVKYPYIHGYPPALHYSVDLRIQTYTKPVTLKYGNSAQNVREYTDIFYSVDRHHSSISSLFLATVGLATVVRIVGQTVLKTCFSYLQRCVLSPTQSFLAEVTHWRSENRRNNAGMNECDWHGCRWLTASVWRAGIRWVYVPARLYTCYMY